MHWVMGTISRYWQHIGEFRLRSVDGATVIPHHSSHVELIPISPISRGEESIQSSSHTKRAARGPAVSGGVAIHLCDRGFPSICLRKKTKEILGFTSDSQYIRYLGNDIKREFRPQFDLKIGKQYGRRG